MLRAISVFIGLNMVCDLILLKGKKRVGKYPERAFHDLLKKNLGTAMVLVMVFEMARVVSDTTFLTVSLSLLLGKLGVDLLLKLSALGAPIPLSLERILHRLNGEG